ncbi:MAG: hypothetical protein UCV58_06500 [Clostridium saudiense]|uniref:hypothetical protein n=1 Tax=uncultured Clostridium sp. TaxID=59620 RepID=UPI0008210E81|nr:hypothetical protein [uncultured Clostridium sp.]MEE0726161.1 hypothetical protein [Clostridium saudiense]SCJ62327.1 Uncharacterised protein [uncultured Clostridium sp.]
MEGLNIWGICTFVMPLVLIIIIWLILIIASILDGVDKLIKRIKKKLRRKLFMNIKVVIKKLEDLREYCSEQVGMYGEQSEWNGDVKALDKVIGILKGTTLSSYEAMSRRLQKKLLVAVWIAIVSTLLNGIGLLANLISLFY